MAITELAESDAVATDGQGDFSQFAPATILVADDVALNRALVAGYFEGTAHKLITATNGLEALEQAEKHRPDVILMDMRMPEMDGLAATRAIRAAERESGRHVVVIALTANVLEGDREACIEAGMDDFLTKPLQLDALRAVLERWLPEGV